MGGHRGPLVTHPTSVDFPRNATPTHSEALNEPILNGERRSLAINSGPGYATSPSCRSSGNTVPRRVGHLLSSSLK